MKALQWVVLFLSFLFLPSAVLKAESSTDVSLSDPTYHFLDQLASHGLIETSIFGQRPYSRKEAARLILEAQQNWEKKKGDPPKLSDKEERRYGRKTKRIEEILEWMEKKYRNEMEALRGGKQKGTKRNLEIHPLSSAQVLLTILDSDPRKFPLDNGVGIIDASSNPLVQNRGGRDYADGAQYAIETEHWADLTRYASFYLKPRFQFQFPFGSEADREKVLVQELYGVFNFHNVEIQAGRSSLFFGQGGHGGLLLSDNARPLDHVHLTNDHPVILPWIFKYLGHNKLTLFWGNLGPESFFPYTHLAGYKWTIKPFSIWEMGLSNVMMIGGEGAPDFGVRDAIVDFIGFSGTNEGASNRILGFDTRVTLPFLRNSQFFLDFFLDDKTFSSFKKTFVDDAAYFAGFYLPRLTDDGKVQGRFEFRALPGRFYRHAQFRSGYTLNGDILGDPLGPDGISFLANIRGDISLLSFVELELSYGESDSNTYNFGGSTITVALDNPTEKRVKSLVTYGRFLNSKMNLMVTMGYEKVFNMNTIPQNSADNFLFEVSFQSSFEDFFH